MVEQQILEKKLNLKTVLSLPVRAGLEEAFGPQDGWILKIGENRLLLNPLNGYWLFEDRLHDGWRFTGFRAGEVLFYLEGGELSVKPNPQPSFWEQDRRFAVAEQFYHLLLRRLEAKVIDPSSFTRGVETLRLQDREGSLWQLAHPGGDWLTWNGAAWVKGEPEREMRLSATGESLRTFTALKENLFILWQQREEGKLTPEDFQQALHNLRTQDQGGPWWQLAEDGRWLKWGGATWVEDLPPV